MGVDYNPAIVIDGLVGCWDAASRRSYPGSGTTWTDLSKEGNDGTLTNGPTLRTSHGGSIKFDGTNDTITTTFNPENVIGDANPYTICVWVKLNDTQTNADIFGSWYASNKRFYLSVLSGLYYWGLGDTYVSSTNTPAQKVVWQHVSLVYEGGSNNMLMYLDSEQTYNQVYSGNGDCPDEQIPVGSAALNAHIAVAQIYNRALTAAEVKQNYYATKGRFDSLSIVTDNLVLHLDAGDDNSYPGTGTTWTDLAGSNDGTLTNGPTFSNSDGGEIVFDGSDDHVTADNISILSSAVGTISFWVNIDSDSGTENDIVSITNNASATQSFLRITADMRSSADYIRPKLVIEGVTKWAAYTSIDSLDQYLGKFLYVTIVQNGIEVYCYFNGQSETLTFDSSSDKTMWISDILTASSPATCMTFGGTRRNGSFGSWSAFDGRIADISIYNRALTAAEVLQNYRALKGRFV